MGSPLRAGPSSSYLVLVTILHFLHTILPTFSPPHVISSPIAAPPQPCPCHLDPSFPVQATYSSSSYQLFNTGTGHDLAQQADVLTEQKKTVRKHSFQSVLQQFEHRMKDYLQGQLAKASLLQLPLPIGSTPATTASGPAATPTPTPPAYFYLTSQSQTSTTRTPYTPSIKSITASPTSNNLAAVYQPTYLSKALSLYLHPILPADETKEVGWIPEAEDEGHHQAFI